ncbi:hypothetical protein CAS74_003608 [Pichia kudriavzevii]|uniref:Uncharacterized protein n=1 Tax=Pichia kudriavzevii TaxID=4909 RepID=A0A099P656_PICKU|nr:uncharacterized protein C5L36_0B05135 [Pichia kudriavzevii]AWU75266.1 hypothetical protein C5L36_0B05135 [Pichia kudriavzevii]KGK39754.1 hypothetical protein JL09_g1084 [Pichia kudriavzevii]ONH73531.1 hypothetical protein BOH78_3120 [Pichia kudriavzevii]OUT21489.1 hypothetical protein CAS74_003608 [Pichia kudriavzevii]
MSKRRSDEDDFSDGVSITSLKSSRSKISLTQSADSLFSNVNQYVDPNTLELCRVIQFIEFFKGNVVGDDEVRLRALKILEKTPDPSITKTLKYNNQTVELPILGEEFQLEYNSTFPFLREPMSISVQCSELLSNTNNYRCFKKIILKNSTLKPILPSIEFYYDTYSQLRFRLQCLLCDSSENQVLCILTDSLLLASNILLRMPHIWYISYELLKSDNSLNLSDKRELICRIWKNLEVLFRKAQNLEVVVKVDPTGAIQVTDLLHNYFT